MIETITSAAGHEELDRKIYGGLLLASSLLSVLAALHHPTLEAHDLATVVRSLAANAPVIRGVHAALILIFLVETLGLYGFARLLGLCRPLAAGGMGLLGLGTIAMLGAATINAFAVPSFATSYHELRPADMAAVAAALRLGWAMNQGLASLGSVAWGGAMLLWSIALVLRSGAARLAGVLGLVGSAAIVVGVATGLIRLQVEGFILVTALLAIWAATVGLLMMLGAIRSA